MPWGLLILLAVGLTLVIVLFTTLMFLGSIRPPRHGAGYALGRGAPADPADLGLSANEWWLDRPNGVRLPVWEIDTNNESGPVNASQTDLTVVIIHGWGMSRYDMLARLDAWREMASKIILYDLRSHGDAQGGRSRIGHEEERDLLDLLDRIESENIILAALSMGAVIALHAMADADESVQKRVKGIVAYGPYAHLHESLRGRLRTQQLPTRPISDLVMWTLKMTGVKHRDLLDSTAKVTCPITIIHGEHDIISPRAHAEQIAGAAQDAALNVLAGASHLDAPFVAQQEHDALVRAFVEKVAVKQSSNLGFEQPVATSL